MTENRKKEICEEYAVCYQNCLSSSYELRMRELEAEVTAVGLVFNMKNEAQYMLPNFIGKPIFELLAV